MLYLIIKIYNLSSKVIYYDKIKLKYKKNYRLILILQSNRVIVYY